ncbi:MAG TPA: OmpA family protein [Polyangiaceae bacterium]|jgi:outer membrane protein OmpA-like peptidoglycan-associated protein|nr:OmpA family protein [Polyangiaceae bacterium]
MKQHHHCITRAVTLCLASVSALAAFGCASPGPTRELVAARTTYNQAVHGVAGKEAPEKLYEAKKALTYAEWVHDDDPGSREERHNGYIALRLTQAAMVEGQARHAQRDLVAQRGQLESARRAVAQMQQTQPQTTVDAVSLCRARLAQLKESDEGLTLSLSGAVLFAFNKATLLPSAERVLDEVATALKSDKQSNRTLTVVGHTDSVGTDAANQALSIARAQAVRNFLIARGVSANRIRAVGRGEAQPVAQNDTPENRAQNRRVEIVISERTASR